MTTGTDWDESSLPYSDPRNSETAMDNASDRYRYSLERRVVEAPGRALDRLRRRNRFARAHHCEGSGKRCTNSRARTSSSSCRRKSVSAVPPKHLRFVPQQPKSLWPAKKRFGVAKRNLVRS
jgi:hypothetical protein